MEWRRRRDGFTLIEIAVVLVIIGLIVGGILVGRDLVRASGIRAQITQIEKFQTAVNTFRGKYGYLPGDIKSAEATTFGFLARGGGAGQGDGNGVIEGVTGNPGTNSGFVSLGGETTVFWRDLTVAQLIEDKFSTAGIAVLVPTVSGTGIDAYFPHAKVENGNYVFVYSTGGLNYYTISTVLSINSAFDLTRIGLTVQQASSIDTKIDDGYPQTGNLTATYSYGGIRIWAAGGGGVGASGTAATPASATTCYDNANTASAIQQYSIRQNGGGNINCALSFRFQ